ncbi:hypothetical protein AB5N19_06986 [Seiridium cardinale]
MAPTQVRAWIEQLPEPGSQGLSPPSIVYPESSFSQKTTRKLGDVLSSLPSPSPSLSPRPLSSVPNHGAEPGQDGSRKRRRLDERANGPSTRRQAVTNVAVANCVQQRRGINPVPASTSQTLPASSSCQRSNATPVQDAGTVVQFSDRETPYRSMSRPYRADEMMPSIEHDSGSNSVMLTHACRGKSRQDAIDISSIPSSTSQQSASFATAQQSQQAPDARVSRSRHATFTWNSSSLTPGSYLIASSPCVRHRHRHRLRTLRQPAVSAVAPVPARSLSTPSSIVRQMKEPFQHRRRITSEEGPRAATFTIREAVSCNILNSTESDMPVTATDSVSSRQREARLDELVLPSIETVDYDTHHSTSEHQMTGVGRCSFNNKHLELLSSDDRSRLRHRLRARQGERSSSLLGRVSTEHTRQLQTQHVSQRNSLVASFSDEIEQNLGDRSIGSNVHRTAAVSRPIHDRFKAFIDRVQSLSVCKGIFPEELGPELQAETGLRLLHPNDQHGFMLERPSRLGFRPNTAFRADFLGTDGQFPDATLLTVRDSPAHPGPQAALKTELSWEFEALKDLVRASRQCSDVSSDDCGGGPSNSWASKVYTPLLDLATRYAFTSTTSCATPESGTDGDVDSAGNIVRTSVRVSQTAMAQMRSRPVSGGSQAYAFVVTPRPHDELDSKLRLNSSKFAHVESDRLSRRPDHNVRSDEHDAMVSSAHHPIGAIFLELRRRCRHSQCGASVLPDLSLSLPSLPSRTCTRLAGWVDAWRAHICQIVDHDEHRNVTSAMPYGSRQAQPQVVPNGPHHAHACKMAPLPVVAMDGADWYLLFIEKDCSLQQDQQPVRIGSTDSIVEAYKLLATLREVTHWVGCDFRQWLEDVL